MISCGAADSAENEGDGHHSLPALPDCIAVISVTDFGSGGYVVVDAQNRKCGREVGTRAWDLYDDLQYGRLQVAEDGTIAIQREENGEVYIYQNGVESIIPAPVEYFFLGESGNVIIYGKSDLDAARWDVSGGESRNISDKMRAVRISGDGAIVSLFDEDYWYLSVNGNEPQKCPGEVFISGQYIYGIYSIWGSTCDTELYTFSGEWRKIMDWSTEDFSYLDIVAHNAEQGEILFGYIPQEAYYYYSCRDGENVPTHISSGNESLMSLDKFAYYYAVMDWKWRKTGSYLMYTVPEGYISDSVPDNLYCMVRDDMAENDGFSIVRLDENMELTEVISDVNSNVFRSQDGRKLWCISGTQIACYDMSARKPEVQYCKEPCGMDTFDEESGLTIAKPFAATSDGSKVCFIGVDGTLWMCTPDTLERPKAVGITGAAEVYCSAEDEFFVLCRETEGRPGDLYKVKRDGECIKEYSGVVDVCITKSNLYILAENENASLASEGYHELYVREGTEYRLLQTQVDRIVPLYSKYY
ncbi:MAG: hypothetical protein K2N43_07435 [Lachnospiraceae bacterium]|nr:hypothetical protein [Lachnospiraceae bacterium]